MILTKEEIVVAAHFLNDNPVDAAKKLINEMNSDHPDILLLMLSLKEINIEDHIIHNLIMSIHVIWYVIVKVKKIQIKEITKFDIINNYFKWQEFLDDWNDSYEEGVEKPYFINREDDLQVFTIHKLDELFGDDIPDNVILAFNGIMKCFEDRIYLIK